MAISVLGLVMAGAVGAFSIGLRTWRATSSGIDASCQASTVLSRMAYGMGDKCGLRAAFSPVSISSDSTGWTITYTVPAAMSGTATEVNRLKYDSGAETISYQGGASGAWNIIGKNILLSTVSPTASDVTIMVRARAVIGDCSTVNEMTSTIAFRNENS